MKIIYVNLLQILFLTFFASATYSEAPTNNPCSTDGSHWTNTIKWSSVYDAKDIPGLIKKGNTIDSLSFHNTMLKISRRGGGVLYFPEGEYHFNSDMTMFDDVVIRGEGIVGKGDESVWLTKFVFPKYIPGFEGMGTPNSTAFKKIVAGVSDKKNFGLVHIDINRAIINFKLDATDGSTLHDNVILYGLRQNNAAIPDPRFPSKIQLDENRGWQRWPLWNGENIILFVENNCIISRCRLNDSTTDNFVMPEYMTNDGYIFDSTRIKFRYDLHTGITVVESNREGDKDIEISNNFLIIPQSSLRLYLHPGIALYIPNKENEKDKVILYEYIKVPKSKGPDYVKGDYINIDNNVVKGRKDEEEILLVNRIFHYSNEYQNNAKKFFRTETICNDEDTLVYHLMSPKTNVVKEKHPLIVFFHGVGEVGSDNPFIHFVNSFTQDDIRLKYPCYILAPQLMDTTDSWVSDDLNAEPTQPISLTIDVIKQMLSEYPIDKKKIYVAGISHGGAAIFEALLRHPKLFATAVVCSYLFLPTEEQLKKIKKTSFLISSGLHDSNLPVKYMRLMAHKLRQAGITVNYKEYAHSNHFSWIPLTKEENFYQWLFTQER